MTKVGNPITDKNNQLVVITGAKGSGKTSLALSYLPPSKVGRLAVIDNENSANNFRQNLMDMGKDFGLYLNTMERFKNLPGDDDLLSRISVGKMPWAGTSEQNAFTDYFKYIVEQINQIPVGKYDCLVIDTGEKLESGMSAYVESNKKVFGITDTGYGKIWSNGVFPLYANLIQGIYDRGISTVIMNFHLKNVWQDRRPVAGKVSHSGKKILYQLSSLMIWLVNDGRNPNGEPAGLILKERMGKVGITEDDEWEIKTMLPPRLPVATWKEIRRYMAEGYDIRNPKSTEVRNDAENDMISELLNDKQMALMLEDAKIEREQNAIAMADAGLLPTQSTETVTIGGESEAPMTKTRLIETWVKSGKGTVPALLAALRNKGIGDENLAERWQEVME